MNISYNWLRELVEFSLSPRDLAARLTMVGLAVDGVEEAGDDFVLEIDLTSNRPDCLSHLGVAREVAAIVGGTVRPPDVRAVRAEGQSADFASVVIEDPDLCPRYAARVVRGVKIGPSPEWLARRLQAIGQRPINNVADITNFVMHELGQPLHAFDLARLDGGRVVVRRARAGEKLKTLDGVERALAPETLVIADASRPSAVAGVMGGEESEISETTADVLIESAYFDPLSVRRTSKALGLSTEASYRFERGTDREGVRLAQDRCVALICELAGGTATVDAIDVYPQKPVPAVVSLRPRRVGELTGLGATADDSLRILLSLGFSPTDASGRESRSELGREPGAGAELSFTVPTWRTDVGIEEDLVEEVARHYGYDRIGEALPPSPIAGQYLSGDARRRAVRRTLNSYGFHEAVNISFIDAANEDRFDLVEGLRRPGGGFVTLSNPIIEGASLMRPTLLPGLLESVRHNFNHGTRSVRLFETGRVFAAGGGDEGRPHEIEAFAIVLTGEGLEEGRATGREPDFYDLKGALEGSADAMGVGGLIFEAARSRHLREGQSARVLLGGVEIGTLGRLDEETAAAYKFRQPIYVAEVSLTALIEAPERAARYAPLPRFPSVVRDVSLLADRGVTYAEMRDAALGLRIEECRGVSLVDVYEGAGLPEGKRSVTLRFEYRADDRTLRDEEVDAMHARVVAALETELGAQQRA